MKFQFRYIWSQDVFKKCDSIVGGKLKCYNLFAYVELLETMYNSRVLKTFVVRSWCVLQHKEMTAKCKLLHK